MIKDNQKRLNRFHVVLDAFVILASYWLAWFVIMVLSPKATVHNRQAMAEVYILAAVMIVPLYLILYAFFHLYTPKRVQGRTDRAGKYHQGQYHRYSGHCAGIVPERQERLCHQLFTVDGSLLLCV